LRVATRLTNRQERVHNARITLVRNAD